MARAEPVPTALPLGGRMVGAQEPLPFGLVCPHHGGPEPVAWQPSQQRGQSGGDASPAAALPGPLQAALPGRTMWVHKPRQASGTRPGAGTPARGRGRAAQPGAAGEAPPVRSSVR